VTPAPTLYTYKVNQVLRVIDGDTMVVSIDLGFNLTLTQTIRVKGINAPEARTTDLEEKARGLAAKAFAEAWLQGKSLLIKTTKDDKYGRMHPLEPRQMRHGLPRGRRQLRQRVLLLLLGRLVLLH
jgi:endonuclease YncB( thermonuclease family)